MHVANALLNWNKKNLIISTDLKKEDLSHFFAPEFQVKANERVYDANFDNYYDFLNIFRRDIKTIDYELEEFICDEDKVAIPLKAKIVRPDESIQVFMAVLILEFNKSSKISLWQEVYTEIE